MSKKVNYGKLVAEDIFPNKRQRKAKICTFIFLNWIKKRGLFASKREIREFSVKLKKKEFTWSDQPFKYSQRNFYGTVLKKLLEYGYLKVGLKYDPGKKPKKGYFLDPDNLEKRLMKKVLNLRKFIEEE
ncbi:MAG: hypothetical protein ACTSSJ_01035 [Candidatus Odinarchaeia archaeon]